MSVEKKNILLTGITEPLQYKPKSSGGGKKRIPERSDISSHAQNVSSKYEIALRDALLSREQIAAIKLKGTYAVFSSMQDFDLVTKSLENRPSGIRLLNVQTDGGITKATVFIPEGKEDFFRKRINQYATEKTKNGNPKNADLIASIEDIKLAMVESFWTDKLDKLPNTISVNCEVWLRYDDGKDLPWTLVEEEFHQLCDEYGIIVNKARHILFPERTVKMVTANREQLKIILSNCNYLSELRRAEEATTFFTSLDKSDQKLWEEDLLSRCTFSDTNVCICLLDAGINGQHPFIAPSLVENGLHSIKLEWGVDDNQNQRGHGTEMAGIAIYGDLQEALESTSQVDVSHKIESVKILPRVGENPRDLYGAITQEAVSLAEIDNPYAKRVICMAVTAPDSTNPDGRPSSWSAALDELTSSSAEDGENQRLFLVSAGNVLPSAFEELDYPSRNTLEPVQNPAQAWNAISIGGYTSKVEVHSYDFRGYHALAEKGALSPYSTTSASWKGSWPIKPEVLFDAGNVATNGDDYDSCDDLSLLTTGHRHNINLFSTICATSSATAQAANFCAKLYAEYPDFWPETIRALMIHSATWTDQMHRQFCSRGSNTSKAQRRYLVRHCGYGIPNLSYAIQCQNNSVNMIVQEEIQPFKKTGSQVKMNEMHIHTFPWPNEVLRDLGATQVKLKVTLSYFIEPSPGEVGWKDRYRYPSFGLRFEVNKTGQSLDEFQRQINKLMNETESDDEDTPRGVNNDWYLGDNTHNYGSVHSDFIVANAVDLCESKYVAVYPVGGWWKERAYLGKSENKARYSLVVSLSTPEVGVDLYNPIINQITMPITIPITD